MKQHYDFIIVGAGSMGSAAAYFLAKEGYGVLAIDQFDPPHEFGSHAGQSRIIRKAYFEHPSYVPLLQRSYDLWKAFEERTGKKFYYETGIVYFGDTNHHTMVGVRNSAAAYDIPLETLSHRESRSRYSGLNIPENFQTLVEPHAGFVRPEYAIQNYLIEAKKLGATVLNNTKVVGWRAYPQHVSVQTKEHEYRASKIIFTAGSWMKTLVPGLHKYLKVTKQNLAWVNIANPERFALGNFPCWFIEDPELGMYYGFPILPFEKFGGPIGMKLASHRPGPVVHPDHVNADLVQEDDENLRSILSRYFNDSQCEIISRKTCLYTYSPDEDFIIDLLPNHHNRVVIAGGFSGHGFKFVPVIGEIIRDLAINEKTSLPVDFLKLGRFA